MGTPRLFRERGIPIVDRYNHNGDDITPADIYCMVSVLECPPARPARIVNAKLCINTVDTIHKAKKYHKFVTTIHCQCNSAGKASYCEKHKRALHRLFCCDILFNFQFINLN